MSQTQAPAAESIHGHEVIEIILAADPPMTLPALADEVHRRFGPQARFHTCSDQGMTLDQLLLFLAQRGKLVVDPEGRVAMDQSQLCNHEH